MYRKEFNRSPESDKNDWARNYLPSYFIKMHATRYTILTPITSRRMRWIGYVARMRDKNCIEYFSR